MPHDKRFPLLAMITISISFFGCQQSTPTASESSPETQSSPAAASTVNAASVEGPGANPDDSHDSASPDTQQQPRPLAHLRFDGDAVDSSTHNSTVELRNADFENDALYVNGKYEYGTADERDEALVCKIRTPALEYDAFTVAIRFKAREFGGQKRNIITGGPSYRWFGLHRSDSGKLTVMMNNGRFMHDTTVSLTADEWFTVVCGVDVSARMMLLHVNGEEVARAELPEQFALDVATSKSKDSDKVWIFTNFSNGSVFHGLVDELVLFDEMLSPTAASVLNLGQ